MHIFQKLRPFWKAVLWTSHHAFPPPPDTDLKSSISRYFCSITKFLSSKTLRFLQCWLPSGGSHLLDSWGWRGCVYFPDAKRGQTNEIAQHQPEESVERWCTFLGGRGEKIPTTNLQTYLETWCNPHDSWINQICCYLFQFGFDLYRYPSTTTKTWKISSETASLRVSASCCVTSFRCCGSRATVILRQQSISPINIAMIHQIVLIILVVTIASCEVAFRIPTNGIEYCMYHLLWAATGNLKGDVVVLGTCKSLSSFNLLALSSSHRRGGNPSSAPFMNDFCASTKFYCVRPTFCDHWICKMNPPCGKRTETNTKRTFWRLLVFQPTVSIFGRAPPSAWLLSFAVPVFSSLLGARLKCATSRSRTVPNFYTIFSESIEPLNLCAISGNKTMDLFSRKYWLVNQNLPEYWIYSLKLPKNNSVSQSPFFSGYVSFTECIVIIIYLGFLSCSWHSPSAMVITLSLSWSPFPSKSERLPPFPDSCLRQTNKNLENSHLKKNEI